MIDIIKSIKKYVKLSPNRVAYDINGDKLTYQELEEKSNKLAYELQQEAKEDRTPIIVYGHKSKYMLISFLACVKSGRAYCPVDISVPFERVNRIIETVQPKIILSVEELGKNEKNIWNLEQIKEKCQTKIEIDDKYCVKDTDVFYIIFTSGSTGNPKGVQISTECLNNFLTWSTKLDSINEKENLTFINQAPFSFDLSVMDLYTSLARGGTLVALDKNTQNDMNKLFEVLEKSNANVWVSTPSFMTMCLADKKFNYELLPKLQTFLFCGETLPNATVSKMLERFKDAHIINTYGPTESTVAVTSMLVTKDVNEQIVPLTVGKPKEGTYIFIQNEEHENLAEGEKGEIVIVGDTVSVGYFKNETVNIKSFDTHIINGKEYRLYRTGDMGYIKDGNLYYCGRMDFQIKLHGYRIEIEDIENNIMKCQGIKSVAVIPIYEEDAITVKYLQAYVVYENEVDNTFEESLKIKEELKEYLPSYMIPKKIKFIDEMPMTNNCKIDRKKLRGL